MAPYDALKCDLFAPSDLLPLFAFLFFCVLAAIFDLPLEDRSSNGAGISSKRSLAGYHGDGQTRSMSWSLPGGDVNDVAEFVFAY